MYSEVVSEISNKNATLVAVSKTKPKSAILDMYEKGQRIFGENRPQEMLEKYETLPKDIEWHMIGHLQKNKVKYIAPFVDLIHSVDNLSLLAKINKEGIKNDRHINYLIQVKIATEESKFGLVPNNTLSFVKEIKNLALSNVSCIGVMAMATFTDDKNVIRSEFQTLKTCFDTLKQAGFNNNESFKVISMGMSGDYKIALEEGSNMVRIGSLIFGAR